MTNSLIGTKVRRNGCVRTIVAVYSHIPRGVWLDQEIDGFRSWNMDELEIVRELVIKEREWDFIAYIKDKPERWGNGKTPAEAIGSFVLSFPEVFEVCVTQ